MAVFVLSTHSASSVPWYGTFVTEIAASIPDAAAEVAGAPSEASSSDPWRRADLPVSQRVEDLLGRMSLEEKVAQLYGVWLEVDEASGEVAPHQRDFAAEGLDWDVVTVNGLGQLTRPYGTLPVEPLTGAQRLARLQAELVARSRLGVPALVHEECLTGLTAWQATVYPSPLSWGASFDPDLVREMAAQIGRTMRALGVHQGLAPLLDVVRDLRWGRVEETIGEDPYLVGLIGSAYVEGLQSEGVMATLKHLVGYSASRAGRNFGPVSVGPRELADVLLPPFEMALRAGARSVMNAYNDIDGVPVAADRSLLTGWLRDEQGFEGTVVSDYFAVSFLEALHGVAASRTQAAAIALDAGIDVELPTANCFGAPLVQAVESGEVSPATLERAVRRVLTQKCELGLLDSMWSPLPPALEDGAADLDPPAHRQLARELARRSVVLLANGGALPLACDARVALVGPRADAPDATFGCYSFPVHVGRRHPEVPLGVSAPTLLEALAACAPGMSIEHVEGCPVTGGTDEAIAAAAAAAGRADVCVAVLGDKAGLFGQGTSGEGCDAADLRLPGRQAELLEAVLATGVPVVLVLLAGRPYDISPQMARLAAVVCSFFPGEEGGVALAEVLTGQVQPSGRLPVSFPAPGGPQPSTYLTAALGRRSEVSNVDPTPLFAFGHGIGYRSVTLERVEPPSRAEWPTDASVGVAVTLRNDTEVDLAEIVQVYLHDPVAEVARPVEVLVGARRVELPARTRRSVHFEVHADLTSYTGRSGRRRVDPGDVELRVGASSADIRGTVALRMVGPGRELGPGRVMTCMSEVGRAELLGTAAAGEE